MESNQVQNSPKSITFEKIGGNSPKGSGADCRKGSGSDFNKS